MKLKDLVVLLNVSQGQIVRNLENNTKPSRYELTTWCNEMRNAEVYLRQLMKGSK